jgi:hypothetical protein
MGEALRPSWRTYYELRTRVKPGKNTVRIVPEELASSLGIGVRRVKVALWNLRTLDVIDYKLAKTEQGKMTITLLVL